MRNNRKQRMDFVEYWAEYVRTHSDKEWSKQQNVIINSCLKNASMTKEQFLDMKRSSKHRYSEPSK